MKLFEVFGEVKIDDKGAGKKLDSTEKKGKSLSKSLGSMGKAVGKAGLAFGAMGAAAGAALFGIAKKTSESLDRIDKMSQKLGLSAESFQEWDFILSQSGASIESLQMGMKTLGMRMDEASQGLGTGAEAFNRLGLSATNADGSLKSQEQMFEETVIALQSMEDATKRNAIANDLLGRSGQELIPLLNSEGGSIDELKAKASELGIVQSEEAVKSGAQFQDSLDQTTRMLKSMGTNIGTKILPIMNKFLNWVMENMPAWKATFKEVVEKYINPVMTKLADIFNEYIVPAFNNFQAWLTENMPAIKATIKSIIEDYVIPIWNELVGVFQEYLLPILKIVFGWIQEFIPVIQQIFSRYLGIVIPVVKRLWTIFKENVLPILKTLFEWLDKNMPAIKKFFETAFNAIFDVIETVYSILDKTLFAALEKVFAWVNDNMDTIKKVFETTFNAIAIVVQTAIDTIKDIVNWIEKVIDKINIFNNKEVKKKDFGSETTVGGKGYVPYGHRAEGGPVSAGKPYVVGEREPELFVPKTDGTILNQDQLGEKVSIGNINVSVKDGYDVKEFGKDLASGISEKLSQNGTPNLVY